MLVSFFSFIRHFSVLFRALGYTDTHFFVLFCIIYDSFRTVVIANLTVAADFSVLLLFIFML